MSKAMEVTDITPELLEMILSTFHTEEEKELARQIVTRFIQCKLPVKVKQYHQPCMQGTYRILCFIRKSAETVIINNKGMGHDGASFQVRMDDRSILENLDRFSENIIRQIVNASDCGYCSPKCSEDKKYTFAYQGTAYTKCRFLCNNFSFRHIQPADIADILYIVNREIAYRQSARR